MNNPTLKLLNSTKYGIAEDSEHKTHLVRGIGDTSTPLEEQPLQKLSLYRVKYPDNIEHYVLAESEDGAKSQTTAKIAYIDLVAYEKTIVTQLPLLIRGWGSDLF
jgi:hypothetical protein